MVFEGAESLGDPYCIINDTSFTCTGAPLWYHYGRGANLLLVNALKSGKPISHIAKTELAAVRIDGPDLFVGDIYIMNVGLSSNQQLIADHGLGIILTPYNAKTEGQPLAILDSGKPFYLMSQRFLAYIEMRVNRLWCQWQS